MKKAVLEAHFSGAYFAEGRTRATHLVVIRAQDDPATEGVAQVDHPGAGTEAKHLWQGGLHCQNEHLKRPSSAGGITKELTGARRRNESQSYDTTQCHILTLYFWK